MNLQEKESLFIFIENKIIESIQTYCQWKFHLKLRKIVFQKEDKYLRENLYLFVKEELKVNAPLLSQYMERPNELNHHPLESIRAATYGWFYDQDYTFKDNLDNSGYNIGWVFITDKDFHENGYEINFVKNCIGELILQKKIKKFHYNGFGYMYAFPNIKNYLDRINYVKHGMQITQLDGFQLFTTDDLIYDKFSENQLDRYFKEVKSELLEKF